MKPADSQKYKIWPRQLASKASGGLLDVFTVIHYFPVNTTEGTQAATAHRGVKLGCGMRKPNLCGVQKTVFVHT